MYFKIYYMLSHASGFLVPLSLLYVYCEIFIKCKNISCFIIKISSANINCLSFFLPSLIIHLRVWRRFRILVETVERIAGVSCPPISCGKPFHCWREANTNGEKHFVALLSLTFG